MGGWVGLVLVSGEEAVEERGSNTIICTLLKVAESSGKFRKVPANSWDAHVDVDLSWCSPHP